MKNFRRLQTLAVALILVLMCAVPASAAIPPQKYGDVKYSDSVDIIDVTAIQRHLAHIENIERKRYEAADVDADGIISIFDATMIQHYLAGIITEFPAGKTFWIDHQMYHVYSDYDSGKAIAGEKVTFTIFGYANPKPETAELYVNHVLVDTNTEGHDLSFIFPEAGTYVVTAAIKDKWGFSQGITLDYVVVDKPADTTKPVITAIYREDPFSSYVEVFANAKYGTEPYEYKFTLEVFDEVKLIQDYSESDVFEFNVFDIFENYTGGDPIGGYTVIVDVKDANGNTATSSYNFQIEDMPLA